MLSQESELSVRVLLNAEEASEYDLAFGIDGVPATLDVKVSRQSLLLTCETSYS